MAAPTILQVMQGLEARLATIEGLRVSDTVPGQINPPAAMIGVPPVEDYQETFGRGVFRLEGQIWVFTSATFDRGGQEALAAYADPTGAESIVSAVYGDKTLGGVVHDVLIRSFRPIGVEEFGAIGYYGGVFDWLAIAQGS